MPVQELSWEEVVRAGTVIFGPTFAVAAQAGGWRAELRNAFRRRALETHPDRAAALGRSETELLREFRAVAEAHEVLARLHGQPLPLLPSPPPARPPRQPPPGARAAPPQGRSPGPPGDPPRGPPAGPPPHAAPPWAAGGLPRRKLRLAEFLYYSGRVSWQHFVGAIAWQRGQRPAVGRIAVGFGFLERGQIAEILERRRQEGAVREPFGQFAVQRGYLTTFQVLALLGQQLRLQQPIGRYFLDQRLVDAGELDEARAAIFRHNARHAA